MLPPLLGAFREAVNPGDTDAFIALFAEDGAKKLISAKGTLIRELKISGS